MDPYPQGKALSGYFEAIQSLQQRVLENQRATLCLAAERMADTIQSGGRIFIFGTGHSHLLAEEGFYRAGGLGAVTPIFSTMLMLHEDAHLSGRIERTTGIAQGIIERYKPEPGEMVFIFSNSGVNQLPVELAQYARQTGLFVVSVSSWAYAQVAPRSTLGVRLDEVADLAIDNGGVPGDAIFQLEGCKWLVGPSSTILGALIWNSLVVECVACLLSRGWNSDQIPVFASLNLPGAAEHNQGIIDKWQKVNPHL